MSAPEAALKQVLVTGAGGRTGGIVFDKLLAREGYATRGMLRSEKARGTRLLCSTLFLYCTWICGS